MQTLEQIEREVRQLPVQEQKVLLARLANLVKDLEGTVSEARESKIKQFFTEWDDNHSVTVGETPTRARTYADNSRFR
jgi:hypothetical protein